MLPQWAVSNNTTLGIIQERIQTQIALPLVSLNGVSTRVISGKLPNGIRLEDNELVGTPVGVSRPVVSKFVIRASTLSGISDRTFTIIVEGEDAPLWVTNAGRLPVGPSGVYFILDSSLIDFELIAADSDIPAGDFLRYYIADGDGELPPGIKLTPEGRLLGQVDPLLSFEFNDSDGGFDSDVFAKLPYDFSIPSGSGLDTYFYDATTYDFSVPTRRPKKLNRTYEFIVTVADNVSDTKRKFQIYVVGDDFVRSDNTLMKAADGIFTADATYLRKPHWLTPANLGLRRANNYLTVFLETLDQNLTSGTIFYLLAPINNDGTLSELPLGLTLDESTGELAGIIPYLPAVTKSFNFTVNAIRNDANFGIVTVFGNLFEAAMVGDTNIKIIKLPRTLVDGLDDLESLAFKEIPIEGRYYTVASVDGTDEDFDTIQLVQPLAPIVNKAVIIVERNVLAGNNYFFINPLSFNDINFYIDKIFRLGNNEYHKINNIVDYIEYNIRANNNVVIGLNNSVTVWQGSISDTLIDFLSVNQNPAYVRIDAANNIIICVPSTAQSRNVNFIKTIFQTSDSSQIYVDIISNIQRVELDSILLRNLNATQQLGFGAIIGSKFNKTFSVAEVDILETSRTFTLSLLGEVDSTIKWDTSVNLGSLAANRLSTLNVRATSTLSDAVIKYYITQGSLPPGLEFKDNGEITGKVPIFTINNLLGLTFFDNNTTTFDGTLTTIDRVFTFTVLAKDRFGYSAISRTFTLTITDIDNKVYSNIYMKPFLTKEKKQSYLQICNDSKLIDPSVVYRPSDINFGIQRELKSLVYAGIETQDISAFVSVAAKNHKRKQYNIGSLQTAVAKAEGTLDILYEIVYLELNDPSSPQSGNTETSYQIINRSTRITTDSVKYDLSTDQFSSNYVSPWRQRPNGNTITADSDAIQLDQNSDNKRYISNIDNMRSRIENIKTSSNNIAATSRDFLPLWMRTPQESGQINLGYVLAIPIVYTLPGFGKIVKDNIANSKFNFNSINYDIDRYIVDATTGNNNEQYILFANYQFNV